jgi:formate hydrogenlyase subunit 6/NADH:ubiquinone oxidoreductase subunit I
MLAPTLRQRGRQSFRPVSAVFLWEFMAAIGVSLRYFIKPQVTVNYPSKKARSVHASAVNMRCAAIQMAKSEALPASCAKPSVQHNAS